MWYHQFSQRKQLAKYKHLGIPPGKFQFTVLESKHYFLYCLKLGSIKSKETHELKLLVIKP